VPSNTETRSSAVSFPLSFARAAIPDMSKSNNDSGGVPAPIELISLSEQRRRDKAAVHRASRVLIKYEPALKARKYRPLVLNYARVALLCERAYARAMEQMAINPDGDLPSCLDGYRRMAAELRAMARELGLSPTVASLLTKPAPILDLDDMRRANDDDDDDEQKIG